MPANKKKTSSGVASDAGPVLNDPNASEVQKRLAGSALSQRSRERQTSKEMEEFPSMVMKSDKYAGETKEMAATVLSQANKGH